MEMNDVARAPCNSCGQTTNHLVVAVRRVDEWMLDEFRDTGHPSDLIHEFAMLECGGCQSISLRVDHYTNNDDIGEENFLEGTDYYPPRIDRRQPSWLSELPLQLRQLMDEVYEALGTDSRRLALMGVRTAVEMVMTAKVGSAGTFGNRLQALEAKGLIGKQNAQVLGAVVDAGSAAAHRAYEPSARILSQIMDIVENLLQAVYVLPRSSTTIKKSTPRRARRRLRKAA